MNLSDIEPETVTWKADIASSIEDELSAFFKPRTNRNFQNKPLSLRIEDTTKIYSSGLCVLSHSELTYRIANEYRRFQSIVGIDAGVSSQGDAQLEVWGDSKLLFSSPLNSADKPIELDIDLSGVRRMRIVVGLGGTLNNSDYVSFCNARLIK